MRILLGFLFGANYAGNRLLRAFLLLVPLLVLYLYQMSKPLGGPVLIVICRETTMGQPSLQTASAREWTFLAVSIRRAVHDQKHFSAIQETPASL